MTRHCHGTSVRRRPFQYMQLMRANLPREHQCSKCSRVVCRSDELCCKVVQGAGEISGHCERGSSRLQWIQLVFQYMRCMHFHTSATSHAIRQGSVIQQHDPELETKRGLSIRNAEAVHVSPGQSLSQYTRHRKSTANRGARLQRSLQILMSRDERTGREMHDALHAEAVEESRD